MNTLLKLRYLYEMAIESGRRTLRNGRPFHRSKEAARTSSPSLSLSWKDEYGRNTYFLFQVIPIQVLKYLTPSAIFFSEKGDY